LQIRHDGGLVGCLEQRGDPNRFKTLGELVVAIFRTMWEYNHERIHSALKMPPAAFAKKLAA
jgi:transposase InsO family protein